ncbi:hypothetical protein CEP54_013816 [Fusarium duplospermum]|uniref:Amino acid permease n=1 Tax=Fusarium duplospermum TaxID=1325734 RepID=A0A428P0K6_9HYPO|nr:hypothetical protein CEP54_013816 [Fusarium duplospermum]
MSHHAPQNSAEGHLRPRLSKLTMVAMTFAILNTWIALGGTIGIVMPSGGPVAFLYGFIFCVLCNFALAASLGELAAIWPTAGGQYHFVFALSPDKWKALLSFWAGWINIAGWLTLVTTEAFFGALFISAASVVASNGSYVAEAWKTYLIFLSILTFSTVSNIWGNKILGPWNNLALYWSILSVVIISILLLSTSDKTSARFVFTEFRNETGWSDGMSWILGLLQSALSLIGYDAVLHMTEEMPNPSRDAPLAIVYAIGVGGVTGTIFILVIMFCLTDLPTLIASTTGMPLIELVLQATGSRAAACIVSCMLAICFVHGTNGSITSASRLIYAMARDNGIFLSKYFNHIDPRLEVPVRTILLCFGFNVLFGLLYLGPTVAFNAFIASCTIFLNISYAFPILILSIRGRKLLIQHQSPSTPWKLGNRLGPILNWVAVLYVLVTSVFFCFPPVLPVTLSSMNYVSAVIGIFIIIFTGYWLVYGKQFEGPQFDTIIAQQLEVMENLHGSALGSRKNSHQAVV